VVKKYSAGLTRRINIIADKSLLAAYSEGGHTVTPSHIKLAAQDSEFKKIGMNKNSLYLAGGFILLVGALFTGYYMGRLNPENQILPGMAGSRVMHMSMDGRYKGNAGAIAEEQRSGVSNRVAQERLKQMPSASAQLAEVAPTVSTQNSVLTNNHVQNNAVPGGIAERLEETQQWLAEAVGNHYSIQLFIARTSNADKVEAFLENAPEMLDFTKIYIYETVINGHQWYSVLYNDFSTHSKAMRSLDSLPSSLKASGAYLRRIRALKK